MMEQHLHPPEGVLLIDVLGVHAFDSVELQAVFCWIPISEHDTDSFS